MIPGHERLLRTSALASNVVEGLLGGKLGGSQKSAINFLIFLLNGGRKIVTQRINLLILFRNSFKFVDHQILHDIQSCLVFWT